MRRSGPAEAIKGRHPLTWTKTADEVLPHATVNEIQPQDFVVLGETRGLEVRKCLCCLGESRLLKS